MTNEEILSKISSKTGDDNINYTLILDDINTHLKYIYNRIIKRDSNYYKLNKTITLVSGTTLYDIEDEDFKKIYKVKQLSTSLDINELPITSPNSTVNGFYLAGKNGNYQQIAFTGFGSDTSRYVEYFSKIDEIAENNNTPNIPEELHLALVNWGLMAYYDLPNIRDGQEAQKWESKAKEVEREFFHYFNKENLVSTPLNVNYL